MILGFIIVFLFCLLIKHFGTRKSFCVYFVFMLLDTGIPFVPQIPATLAILFVFFFKFLLNCHIYKTEKYPLFLFSVLYSVSILLSAKYTSVTPHTGMVFKGLIKSLLIPYLCFYFVRDFSDAKFLTKMFFLGALFVFANLVLELVTGEAYIQKFIGSMNGGEEVAMQNVYRYGIKRCQSIFIHSTSLGYFCVMMFSFLTLYFTRDVLRKFKISKKLFWLVVGVLALCTLISGTRSAIIPLGLVSFYLYLGYSKRKTANAIGFGILSALLIASLASDFVINIFDSVFNSTSNKVGSSSDMRWEQFELTFYYWSSHPILGWGPGATFDDLVHRDWHLLGAESVWMPLLMDNGIVGCLAYAYGYVAIMIMNKVNRWKCGVFMLAFLIVNTLTSVPGFGVNFILSMGIIFYKFNRVCAK